MTSGATAGLKRSWALIPTVAAGYTIGTFVLGVVIAPLLHASPWLDVGLRVACAALLIFIAARLWLEGSDVLRKAEPVSVARLFTATMLNPKNIGFALVIVPHLQDGKLVESPPYLGGLFTMAIAVAVLWAGAGAVARATAKERVDTGVMRKTGAGLLAVFGFLMAGSTLPFASALAAG
jgi:threonine/homoserine/homoserine lactone efflux protein